ncbi:MAG: aminopeptidase [Solibacillus sp.]
MKKYAQIQYQGLNLLDEVGTVEIAIDYELGIVHVYDTQQIVAPEYDFQMKNYRLTDSFYKMAAIIRQKNFLSRAEQATLEQWVEKSTWYFYGITPVIKRYAKSTMTTEPMGTSKYKDEFYTKYIERLI